MRGFEAYRRNQLGDMVDQQLNARIDSAMRYFIGKGWTPFQAAGIVANLQAESNVNPNQTQHGGGPGYGLAQWEHPRQQDFRIWSGHDIHQSTFQEQLDFIQHELGTTQRDAGRALHASQSASDAGAVICRLYERPADTERQATYRANLATKIMAGWNHPWPADFSNVQAGSESTA